MQLSEEAAKLLCKCSRRDATYGALVVMALMIILTLLREAPLIVIVADHKALQHYNSHVPGGNHAPPMHGPPVPGPIEDIDAPLLVPNKGVSPAKKDDKPKESTKQKIVRVFSVATNISNPLFVLFSDSARKSKVHVEVLGEGDMLMVEEPLTPAERKDPKNKKAFHSRSNFGRKLLHLHQACEQLPNKDTLVVLVDSYDSLFTGSDLIGGFERARDFAISLIAKGELPPEIIAGGEMNCWPDKNMTSLYPKYSIRQKMRYLNSGVVAGPASAFLKLFKNFPYTGQESSDQRYWANAFIASQTDDNLPVIDVDYHGHLVATVSKSSWPLLSFSQGKPKVKGLTGKPQILHLPNNKDRVSECFKLISTKATFTGSA